MHLFAHHAGRHQTADSFTGRLFTLPAHFFLGFPILALDLLRILRLGIATNNVEACYIAIQIERLGFDAQFLCSRKHPHKASTTHAFPLRRRPRLHPIPPLDIIATEFQKRSGYSKQIAKLDVHTNWHNSLFQIRTIPPQSIISHHFPSLNLRATDSCEVQMLQTDREAIHTQTSVLNRFKSEITAAQSRQLKAQSPATT
ncbi:hypothetical protein DFH06DRAFT_1321951 [Mycena polygramma]|nr:hypothetical protein DFH06DRAFT_1321951 [Mycena polygramma]